MFGMEILSVAAIFFAGILCGVLTVLLVNKIRSGSVSPTRIKKEKEAYQTQVEAHFEETSRKFKQMANQYQDLYKHLSVGATTLCRPENIAPGLSDQRDPLAADANADSKSPKIIESQKPSDKSASADRGKPVNELKSEAKSEPKSEAKSEAKSESKPGSRPQGNAKPEVPIKAAEKQQAPASKTPSPGK